MIVLKCLNCGLTVAYRASEADFCPRCLVRDRQSVKLLPVSDRPASVSGRSMGRMSIHSTGQGADRKLSLSGELDIASAPLLELALSEACAEGAKKVVLDMAGIEFMDSMGLRAILRGRATCEGHECEYDLTPAKQPVQRVLRDTGVLNRIPFRKVARR